MLDFDVKRSARKCIKTEREFEPGETFFSVLVASGSDVERQDYCRQAWEGPPEEAIGWWKSQMPTTQAKQANLAPNEVILQYFQQLAEAPEEDRLSRDMQYIVALLMVRRRIMRLDDTQEDESGKQWMVLYCPRNETEYRVEIMLPTQTRAAEIQEQLAQLLYADTV